MNIYSQSCDYDISTNPDNANNTQMSSLFPTRDNQFLNSFDFGEIQVQTLAPISLNPAAGWNVPDWPNPPIFQMRNQSSWLLKTPNRNGKSPEWDGAKFIINYTLTSVIGLNLLSSDRFIEFNTK